MVAAFDYKSFAKDLTKQAENSMPEDIASLHKKAFLERIYNFTYIAGEAFSNDDSIDNSDTAKTLTQMISEWTFHKYVDLLRSDIPEMYHESILQKLAYVAFEMCKESELGKLSQEQMLVLVELQIKKAFEKSCKNLLDNGLITVSAYERAINLSNIDDYSSKLCYNVKVAPRSRKTFKFTFAALILGVITLLVNLFYHGAAGLVLFNSTMMVVLSMYVGFYIGANIYSVK